MKPLEAGQPEGAWPPGAKPRRGERDIAEVRNSGEEGAGSRAQEEGGGRSVRFGKQGGGSTREGSPQTIVRAEFQGEKLVSGYAGDSGGLSDAVNQPAPNVVKFRRTGESSRSEDDAISGEHEIQIEGVRSDLEAVELEDGAAVPKEFANPTDDTFMVEDAVEAIGFGKFQWKLSVLTGLAWMADAMEMMILSILAPQLHCEWRLPSWQVALLTSVVFVGMMSSSTLWGNISDQYGRKTGLKISVLWTLYYGILSAFAPVYSWILVLRGLVGFGIGGVPQSVTLYAEFLPMKARAKCILLIEVFWAIGTVFEVVLAVFVMPSLGWRWLLILSAVPLLLFAILCFWLPESARYDVLSGNQEKAIATLKRIATENGAPMPLGKLIISRQEDRGKIRDLFTPQFRWTTLLLWFIWSCMISISSVSSRRKAVKAKCSLACEYLTEEDYMDLLLTTLSEFPGILVTVWIIDRLGRKKTMALSFFVFSFCSLLLLICVGRSALTVLLFISRAFISGGFQAAYVYTPEVYPTATRALGLGTCSGMARVGALITPFIAQVGDFRRRKEGGRRGSHGRALCLRDAGGRSP
ncbi:synaptic vesicle 2-related protein [Gracilinanus agilis]|uniref:synaptic vesicle 2-related protein n=1 Tax=Gracilinanus agilis TaxID=191870 RepID=UPI001CFD1ACF|nr:synaptic vesicle 2-related protein [Gracilinanus agilis]